MNQNYNKKKRVIIAANIKLPWLIWSFTLNNIYMYIEINFSTDIGSILNSYNITNFIHILLDAKTLKKIGFYSWWYPINQLININKLFKDN